MRTAVSFSLTLIMICVGLWPSISTAQGKRVFEQRRRRMVREEIRNAGIANKRVLKAMGKVPRHEFVPLAQREQAYFDMSLPIGESQTISAPFIVALMTEAIDPQPEDKVLDIGTGSGYQAAVLAELVKEVYTIEIVRKLGVKAEKTLRRVGYKNVTAKIGDGYQGWKKHAPFDKILVACSPEKVPQALKDQLKEGGMLVIPVGTRYQQRIYLFKKKDGKLISHALLPTYFVPMTGKAEGRRKVKPDPKKPEVINGDFETLLQGGKKADVWAFQRQMKIIEDKASPSGKRYALFSNEHPGRNAHATQGFAIDGRTVRQLKFSLQIRTDDVRPGRFEKQLPYIGITFFDSNRAAIGEAKIGPWFGTNDWSKVVENINVPPRTREAGMWIGLLGATGKIGFDDIQITPISKPARRK